MPFTRRSTRRFFLQRVAIEIPLFTANGLTPLVQQFVELAPLIATPRTREAWPSARVRNFLPTLRNLLRAINRAIERLQRLREAVHEAIVKISPTEADLPTRQPNRRR